jgi:hypothetical protein
MGEFSLSSSKALCIMDDQIHLLPLRKSVNKDATYSEKLTYELVVE